MSPYEVYLHVGLLDVVPKSGAQRRKIMDFILSLRDRPNTQGDYAEKDESLRERQVKIIGDYAIAYLLDDPAKAVMIIEIRPADRR